MGDLICKKLFDEGYLNNSKKDSTASASTAVPAKSMIDLKKRKSSNTSSDILSISGSSVASLNTEHAPYGGPVGGGGGGPSSSSYTSAPRQAGDAKGEIRAETLAEIEVTTLQLSSVLTTISNYHFFFNPQIRHLRSY